MKIARYFLLTAAAFLLLAPVAHAQQSPAYLPGYFSLMGGVYVPEGTDLDDNNADTGFTGLLAFGYMANPFIGFQTDVGYFETSGDNNLQVSAIPVVVSLKAGIPIAFIEPYVLGGGGVYFASTEVGNLNENSVEFGAHAAAGINFNFGGFQIGAESRYIWLEANGLNVDGLLVMGKIGARF
jgi:hypothetical protein